MTTIMCLSDEIISFILNNESVDIKDVLNFASTCKRFHDIVNETNIFWKKKLFQRWPYLKDIYDIHIREDVNFKEKVIDTNFKEQVKAIMKYRNKLWCHVSNISQNYLYFCKEDLSDADLKDIDKLFQKNNPEEDTCFMNYYHFFIAELINLLTQSQEQSDLTQRYYAKKLLPYLVRYRMKETWQAFINYPFKMQTLEQAASIVAQWLQPQKYISHLHVKAMLDDITQQVLECLKKEYPKHSIFSTSTEQFSFWKHHNIDNDQWNITEGQQIINHIRKTLYDDLGFSGIGTRFSKHIVKLEDGLIDCVLKNKVGNSVCMAVIFQAVARRLGICCNLITFPSHLFLIWKPKYNSVKSENEDYFYIDVISNGAIRSSRDCPKIRGGKRCPIESFNKWKEIDPVQMMLLMIRNLQLVNCYDNSNYFNRRAHNHSLLELQYLIEPENLETMEQLTDYYARRCMDLSDFLTVLHKWIFREITSSLPAPEDPDTDLRIFQFRQMIDIIKAYQQCSNRPITYFDPRPRRKTNQIKFSIGEFVKYRDRSNEYYTGIIIAWKRSLTPKDFHLIFDFRNYILIEGKEDVKRKFCRGSKLPYYIIFSEDGTKFYVSQDAIIETISLKWINHEEIGRYFCKFEKTHYVPNQMLQKLYPFF